MRLKIGLEIHAQLTVASKLFSNSSSACTGLPNASVALFDAAYPGTLPVLNSGCVQQAVRAAIALNCEVKPKSSFERKHYFYQDLPLGFQITQRLNPIAAAGKLPFKYECMENSKPTVKLFEVGIDRIQLEQDSGKSVHDQLPQSTLVDLNRAGVALIEIVFQPDLSTPEQAAGVLRTTQELLRHIGVSDGNLETGSMRCDVNISVSHEGQTLPSKRVEVKNLNSLQRVRDATAYEAKRQMDLIKNGLEVLQETRSFDVATGKTFKIRDKETDVDYRYMPEPDLPELLLSDNDIESLRSTMPELPTMSIQRLQDKHSLTLVQAETLVSRQGLAYFEEAALFLNISVNNYLSANPKASLVEGANSSNILYNWMFGDLAGHLNNSNCEYATSHVTPKQLAKLLLLLLTNQISGPQAKLLLSELYLENQPSLEPQDLKKRLGFEKISDKAELRGPCLEALRDPKNAKQREKLESGNRRILQFFMGDVMRKTNSQGDPKVIAKLLEEISDELYPLK